MILGPANSVDEHQSLRSIDVAYFTLYSKFKQSRQFSFFELIAPEGEWFRKTINMLNEARLQPGPSVKAVVNIRNEGEGKWT